MLEFVMLQTAFVLFAHIFDFALIARAAGGNQFFYGIDVVGMNVNLKDILGLGQHY